MGQPMKGRAHSPTEWSAAALRPGCPESTGGFVTQRLAYSQEHRRCRRLQYLAAPGQFASPLKPVDPLADAANPVG